MISAITLSAQSIFAAWTTRGELDEAHLVDGLAEEVAAGAALAGVVKPGRTRGDVGHRAGGQSILAAWTTWRGDQGHRVGEVIRAIMLEGSLYLLHGLLSDAARTSCRGVQPGQHLSHRRMKTLMPLRRIANTCAPGVRSPRSSRP